MVDGEKGSATNPGLPATPFPVEGTIEKATEEEFFGDGSEADGEEELPGQLFVKGSTDFGDFLHVRLSQRQGGEKENG